VLYSSARIKFAACVPFALCGCVSSSAVPYPPSWPKVDTIRREDCTHFDGQFDVNPKLVAPANQSAARLIYWFAGSNWEIRTRSLDEVEVKVHDGRLVVRAYSRGYEGRVDVPTENWRCVNGQLVSTPPMPTSGEGHAVGHVSGQVALDRAENHALVVHVRSTESGLSMIVPFRESNESWFQYPAITAEARANPSLERTRDR